MPNETLIAELTPLLEALCEDRIAPDETAHLERLVMSSPEARWYYLCYVDLHGSLYWNAAGAGSAEALSADEIPAWNGSVSEAAAVLDGSVNQSGLNVAASAVSTLKPRGSDSKSKWRAIQKVPVLALSAAAICLAVLGVYAWQSGLREIEIASGTAIPSHIEARDESKSQFGQTQAMTSLDGVDPTTKKPGSGDSNKRSIREVVLSPGGSIVPDDGMSEKHSPVVTRTFQPVVPAPPETVRENVDSNSVIEGINHELQRGWKTAGVQPSPRADDAEWLRRVSLDLIGRIPTVVEAESFFADTRSDKRTRLIDTLLDDSAYARNFTTVWTNLLIGRRPNPVVDRDALQKFLRMAFAENRSWNQIVYDLVSAEGSNSENGATNFLIAHLNNDALPATAVTARLFLGQQLQCNQCHNNPFAKTQQTAFWELHSFFSQTASIPRHERDAHTGALKYRHTDLVTRDAGGPIYYETQNGLMRVAYPRFNGLEVDASPETNRRAVLARLMTEGDQPSLAAAYVNRMWSHFLGCGFTADVDDIGPHSPASHPELFELLIRKFIQSGYDTKQLVRWICGSAAYQLASRTTEANRDDEPTEGATPQFSRMYVKSMTAEQLYDSFLVATKAHQVGVVDWSQAERQRQQWLAQFVINFETDENEESMEFDGTMSQALTLMNGPLIEKALELSSGTFLGEVVRQKSDDVKKIRQLCLAILSRPPSQNELVSMRKLIQESASHRGSKSFNRKDSNADGYQDLVWALLNSNEFALVH